MALKKTGKVWVSTQEKDRLRCRDRLGERHQQSETTGHDQQSSQSKVKHKVNLLRVRWDVKLFEYFKYPNT